VLFVCFLFVTSQLDTSYIHFRGVTKCPTQACTIQTSQNDMDLKDVAYTLECVRLEKMLPLKVITAKKGTKLKVLILGLGNRVRFYKQEKDHVPLMEWSDLRKLQGETARDSKGKHVYVDCI